LLSQLPRMSSYSHIYVPLMHAILNHTELEAGSTFFRLKRGPHTILSGAFWFNNIRNASSRPMSACSSVPETNRASGSG
jgi:hypothetical protein